MITELQANEVFVFGSNLAGRHGAGAAKQALKWGAIYGVGVGHRGKTYAIPTKDENIQTLPLYQIKEYVKEFISYAKDRPEIFLVTAIGCGLAGYQPKDIAPMFNDVSKNIVLPKEFTNV